MYLYKCLNYINVDDIEVYKIILNFKQIPKRNY